MFHSSVALQERNLFHLSPISLQSSLKITQVGVIQRLASFARSKEQWRWNRRRSSTERRELRTQWNIADDNVDRNHQVSGKGTRIDDQLIIPGRNIIVIFKFLILINENKARENLNSIRHVDDGTVRQAGWSYRRNVNGNAIPIVGLAKLAARYFSDGSRVDVRLALSAKHNNLKWKEKQRDWFYCPNKSNR